MSTTSTPPQRPSTNDPDEWPAYWKALDQPWRTQPEIDGDRQNFLKKCLAIVSDLQGIRISAPVGMRDELLSPLYRLFHSLTVPFSGLYMLIPCETVPCFKD